MTLTPASDSHCRKKANYTKPRALVSCCVAALISIEVEPWKPQIEHSNVHYQRHLLPRYRRYVRGMESTLPGIRHFLLHVSASRPLCPRQVNVDPVIVHPQGARGRVLYKIKSQCSIAQFHKSAAQQTGNMALSKSSRIIILLAIDSAFFLLELVVGYAVHSLALVADAFHMLNDVLSLCVGLWAVKVAQQKTSNKMYTYGVRKTSC